MTENCSPIRTELVAYLKGEVGPAVRADIDLHLAGCAACRDELASVEALFRIARGQAAVEASPDFRLAWRQRLAEARQPALARWRWPRAPGQGIHRRYAALLGLALVLLAVVAGWLRDRRQPSSPPPAIAGGMQAPHPAANDPWDCVERSLDWLAGEQDRGSGAWHPDRFGGDAQAQVGVSALALLAFLEGTESQRLRHQDVIDRAARFVDGSADTEFWFGNVPGNELVSRFNHAAAVLALCERNRLAGKPPTQGLAHNAVLNLMSLERPTRRERPYSYEAAFLDLALQVAGGVRASERPPPRFTLLASSTTAPWSAPAGTAANHTPASLPALLQALASPAQREPAFLLFATRMSRERGGADWLRFRELLIDRLTRDQQPDGSFDSLYRWACLDGGSLYSTAVAALTLHVCLGSFFG